MRAPACATCAYTPYGYNRNSNSQLSFSGEFREPVTGLYPLGNGHRMYHPALMRFISPDNRSPFGQGGLNGYAYCGNDPINWHDPTGEWRQLTGLVKTALKLLTGGGTVAALKEHAEFFGAVHTTAKQAVTRGPISVQDAPVERRMLMQNANKASRPFNDSVNGVNYNLASHGDASLTDTQARYYISATWSNNSNTTLYFHSAAGWLRGFLKTGQPGTLTGFLFNFAGATGAGALDHNTYKSGQMLTQDFSQPVASIRQ